MLVSALELCQLHGAVDSCDLHCVCNGVGQNAHAVLNRKFHNVGQVILPLGIFIVEPSEPSFEQARRHSHDATVNFGQCLLRRCRIFVFHDGANGITVALNAAITCGVGHIQGKKR